MAEPQRLQKILAHLGVASRRRAEQMILAGRVRVNGQVIQELGVKVDLNQDQIWVDGQAIGSPRHSPEQPSQTTVLLHKPQGVLSTCMDPQGRPTVLDLLPKSWQQRRLYPVGRLDKETTGALLLTNDGDLALHLTHPRYRHPKTYRVRVKGIPSAATLQQWREGVDLGEGRTQPAQVCFDPLSPRGPSQQGRSSILRIVLTEGRKRQIRRVAQLLGHPVLSLHRQAIGSIQLGDLESGQFRLLTQSELSSLKRESRCHHVL